MSDTAPSLACPRCGKVQPERVLVGGLCPACVAGSVRLDLLSLTEPVPTEKEPLSISVPGYEVEELIGGGGMGEVYRARSADGQVVALKVVAGRLTRDPEVTARFELEVAALSQLDHPNVVRVLDHGEMANGRHFLVMEFVDGCDLRRLLRAQRLERETAFDIFHKVCAAVAHAHERGLAHRDLKPENILIGQSGMVKVADFGLAKTLADTVVGYGFTQTRDTFGTPYYVAPEVTRDAGKADARSDVYALGVLLYEMLSGAVPMGQFTPLSAKTGMDRRIDAVVSRALADDPARRLASVTELASAVRQIADDHRRGHLRKLRRAKWLVAAAAVMVLGIGAAFGAWYAGKRNNAAKPPRRPPETATRQDPWTNSIGMKFAPVPQTNLLCSIWETRIRDFEEFIQADTAMLPNWRWGENDNRFRLVTRRATEQAGDGKKVRERYTWRNPGPGFDQTPEHPVCGVTLLHVRMFCAWLTWKERMEGHITNQQLYRLPTNDEWSQASGRRDKTTESKAMLAALAAGDPAATANFAGPEVADALPWSYLHLDRRDPFSRTAPVGSFAPNSHGLYDMSGNLAEWTDTESPPDASTPNLHYHYIRGGAWSTGKPELCKLEHRRHMQTNGAGPSLGFRIVLDLKAAEAEPQEMPEFSPDAGPE